MEHGSSYHTVGDLMAATLWAVLFSSCNTWVISGDAITKGEILDQHIWAQLPLLILAIWVLLAFLPLVILTSRSPSPTPLSSLELFSQLSQRLCVSSGACQEIELLGQCPVAVTERCFGLGWPSAISCFKCSLIWSYWNLLPGHPSLGVRALQGVGLAVFRSWHTV